MSPDSYCEICNHHIRPHNTICKYCECEISSRKLLEAEKKQERYGYNDGKNKKTRFRHIKKKIMKQNQNITLTKKPIYKDLAKHLGVTEQAVKQYPKNKRVLMVHGLWLMNSIKKEK